MPGENIVKREDDGFGAVHGWVKEDNMEFPFFKVSFR